MANETATLASYVANLKFEDIPREVLERAKVLTLDFLGSAIRARRDAESTPSLLKMLESLALDGKGESTVFGDTRTWTPAVAALLTLALAVVLAPGEAVPPGMVLLVCGLAVMAAGIALVVLVLRMLLAQAVARDTEAQHLRAELDEVI